MILTKREKKQYNELVSRFENDEHVQQMKQYIQHGSVSTYAHCHNVARVSFWMNRRFHLKADESVLVTGAFLHDFYLYDWHKKEAWHSFHGFFHAERAKRNAVKYFHVGKKEQKVIESHMWPLNLTQFPNSREAAIVCAADKYCSFVETLMQRRKGYAICR